LDGLNASENAQEGGAGGEVEGGQAEGLKNNASFDRTEENDTADSLVADKEENVASATMGGADDSKDRPDPATNGTDQPIESSAAIPTLIRPPSPSSRTSTPPLASGSAPKKFSSININKKFLSKTSSPAAGSPAAGAKLGLTSELSRKHRFEDARLTDRCIPRADHHRIHSTLVHQTHHFPIKQSYLHDEYLRSYRNGGARKLALGQARAR
jgi:hypothetical protein